MQSFMRSNLIQFIVAVSCILALYQNCAQTGGSSAGAAGLISTSSGTTSGNLLNSGTVPVNLVCTLQVTPTKEGTGNATSFWTFQLVPSSPLPSGSLITWLGSNNGQGIEPVGPFSVDVGGYQWMMNFAEGSYTRYLVLTDPDSGQTLCTTNMVSVP